MKLYSNEIVFRGHPDKVCDQISDAILEECLKSDENSRCGIEVCGGKGKIFVTGEVTTKASINVEKIVKAVLDSVGYDTNYEIINNLGVQSTDIALGTNEEVNGAGDNGMMFGYATNDTEYYLPVSMVILQLFSEAYANLVKEDNRFLPDGKAEITGLYDNDKLIKITNFTICYQNTELEREETDKIIIKLAKEICNKYNVSVDEFITNPTGRFNIGGFSGDAGLTGRKIVVDSYHSFARVGGGAFSGKDPSKVDRSAAYYARYVAKNVVAAGLADKIEIQVSYLIGVKNPISISINTFNTNKISEEKILGIINKVFDFSVKNIISELDLKHLDYTKTTCFGHFGKNNLSYEKLNKVDLIKSMI